LTIKKKQTGSSTKVIMRPKKELSKRRTISNLFDKPLRPPVIEQN
jgi:hypothetical protein